MSDDAAAREAAAAAPEPEASAAAPLTAERAFPCTGCGARVVFAPGTDHLVCPYCGVQTAIPDAGEPLEELDFKAMLAVLADHEETEDHPAVQCGSCAAVLDRPPDITALRCPFCDTPIVLTNQSRRLIKPKGVLPFILTAQQARERLAAWIRKRWFAPSDLKQTATIEGRLRGIYVPHWTYDAQTLSQYHGARGTHYYTTQSYTTTVNGRSVQRTRQVQHTRWTPVSGALSLAFDDVLVPASESLPTQHLGALLPWDLSELKPYADDYLSGFESEQYQLDLAEGFVRARAIMDERIRDAIRREIGGDEQRIDQVATRHENVTFKHVLLPVWVSAYHYGGKLYRCLVNARTGQVRGDRPYSWIKIAAAVLAGLILVIGGYLLFQAGAAP